MSTINPNSSLFRVLDLLADGTNIVLIGWLLVALVLKTKSGAANWKNWSAVFLSVAVVYIVKSIDSKLHIWESAGLNYSTHSALAAVLVLSICFFDRARRAPAIGVFVAYEVLQMLLGFHSLLDILSTLLVVVPTIWLCLARFGARPASVELN